MSARIRQVVRRNHWRHELEAARRRLARIAPTVDGHAQAEAWRDGVQETTTKDAKDFDGFAVEVAR